MSWPSKARELLAYEAKNKTIDDDDLKVIQWLADHPDADEPYYTLKVLIETRLSDHRNLATVGPISSERNALALSVLRETIATTTDDTVTVDLEELKCAIAGRMGEVSSEMRGANITEAARVAGEIRLHNLALLIVDIDNCRITDPVFTTDDLRIVLTG
jgi:hypothetical protein